jgi:hypothetical protein
MATAPPAISTDEAIARAGVILDGAAAAGVLLRATGGVAVATISPAARSAPLRRTYQDIDFFGLSRDADSLSKFFVSEGYVPEEEFNALHGQRRLFFREPEGRWEADVFLDRIEMCHELDVRHRLTTRPRTLAPADLLLSKLQVMETNEKDLLDVLALLADHELEEGDGDGQISLGRVGELCNNDWGWWRTVTIVAGRAVDAAQRLATEADPVAVDALRRARSRAQALIAHLDGTPKSRKWKLRARVGERKRWYETPEDIDHEEY